MTWSLFNHNFNHLQFQCNAYYLWCRAQHDRDSTILYWPATNLRSDGYLGGYGTTDNVTVSATDPAAYADYTTAFIPGECDTGGNGVYAWEHDDLSGGSNLILPNAVNYQWEYSLVVRGTGGTSHDYWLNWYESYTNDVDSGRITPSVLVRSTNTGDISIATGADSSDQTNYPTSKTFTGALPIDGDPHIVNVRFTGLKSTYFGPNGSQEWGYTTIELYVDAALVGSLTPRWKFNGFLADMNWTYAPASPHEIHLPGDSAEGYFSHIIFDPTFSLDHAEQLLAWNRNHTGYTP